MQHLQVSRRGIVHVTEGLDDNAATACGKGSRDLVYVGGVGPGERMCLICATTRGEQSAETNESEPTDA